MSWWDRWASAGSSSRQPETAVLFGRVLQGLVAKLKRQQHPHVLDLGQTSGANIDYFVQLGCKVHVDDYIVSLLARPRSRPVHEGRPGQEGTKRLRRGGRAPTQEAVAPRIPRLEHESGRFQAVLCWDLFDYVTAGEIGCIGEEISRVTAPGGFIFALFGPPHRGEVRSPQRFCLRGDGLAEARDVGPSKVRPLHLPNREIVKIFHQFDTSRTVLLRNGTREMLFQKHAAHPRRSISAVPAPS